MRESEMLLAVGIIVWGCFISSYQIDYHTHGTLWEVLPAALLSAISPKYEVIDKQYTIIRRILIQYNPVNDWGDWGSIFMTIISSKDRQAYIDNTHYFNDN